MSTPKPSDMPGAVLPHQYNLRLTNGADPRLVGRHCARPLEHTGPGCQHDFTIELEDVAAARPEVHRLERDIARGTVHTAQPAPAAAVPHARISHDQRHDVAVALEVASRAARMSAMTKVLSARERQLAEQLHDEIVGRLFRNVRLSSSGPGVTSPTSGPDATPQ